jgi:hypothetical protein
MNKYEIASTYRQFYVADAGLEQKAPDEWTDEHIEQHFNTLENIAALVTEGDITARINCYPLGESSEISEAPSFEVSTEIEVPTGIIGIYEWPWEKLEEHRVAPGRYRLKYSGYNLSASEHEQDFYALEITNA